MRESLFVKVLRSGEKIEWLFNNSFVFNFNIRKCNS